MFGSPGSAVSRAGASGLPVSLAAPVGRRPRGRDGGAFDRNRRRPEPPFQSRVFTRTRLNAGRRPGAICTARCPGQAAGLVSCRLHFGRDLRLGWRYGGSFLVGAGSRRSVARGPLGASGISFQGARRRYASRFCARETMLMEAGYPFINAFSLALAAAKREPNRLPSSRWEPPLPPGSPQQRRLPASSPSVPSKKPAKPGRSGHASSAIRRFTECPL